ncbi:unnamed protein product, partial [Schistosoma turkestanicum]
ASLLVGGLYTYDIFAAIPCCTAHLTCGSCQSRLDNLSMESNLNSTSTSSPMSASTTASTTTPTATSQFTSNSLPHHQHYQDSPTPPPPPAHLQSVNTNNETPDPSNNLTIHSYPLNYFSQYSNLIICPYCSKVDYHFVKLFEDFYEVV